MDGIFSSAISAALHDLIIYDIIIYEFDSQLARICCADVYLKYVVGCTALLCAQVLLHSWICNPAHVLSTLLTTSLEHVCPSCLCWTQVH